MSSEEPGSSFQANSKNYGDSQRRGSASKLKATAPEFYPSNSSASVAREVSENTQKQRPRSEAVEFNNGAVRKKPHDRNRRERNTFSSWRSSGYDYSYSRGDTNYGNPQKYNKFKSRKFNNQGTVDASSTSKQESHQPQSSEDLEPEGDSASYPKYERRENRNTHSNNHKFYYDHRNGYNSRVYGRTTKYKTNKHQQNDYYQGFNNARETKESYNTNNNNNAIKKGANYNLPFRKSKELPSTANQKDRLTEMIDNNMLECLVCCEKIRKIDKVWSCTQCYNIIHLDCIIAWAKSSKIDQNWRCPACQNCYKDVPSEYLCYCGKVVDPKVNHNIIAHGCDNMCLKTGKRCDHKCNILCHPGPCPECIIMVSKPCGCGLTQQIVKCCSELEIVCDSICNKTLNCGIHKCPSICHIGPCPPCTESIIQECHCGRTGRKVACTRESFGKTSFECENICGQQLACGNHKCESKCHSGPCKLCDTDVNRVKCCHCGKTVLTDTRTSCLDPIPCCDNICGKTLICGPPSKPHTCKEKCHQGKCPACPLTTILKCRCGHMDKEVDCVKLTTRADDARCEKKCVKKRLCGKHTCKQKCCIEIEHVCPLPCNKLLSCGLHRCELTCHSGRCPPCMESSFDELYCHCGATVLYPPIPCGTKPPACSKPCSRGRPCGHPANHECHSGSCPACFVLTKQWCFGKHEQRAAIPCNQNSFSCGLPCGKPMPCGRHKCIKPCHEDECPIPCTQPCLVPRSMCGHPCGKPCHEPPCPESSCKQTVTVTCLCGHQKSAKACLDLVDEYKNLEMAHLKDKISNLSYNQTVDLSDMAVKKPGVFKILECTEECKVLERNRRLAIGLQIQNPDLSQKLTPRYSDFLKQCGKKDPKFCQRIHDKLTELVQLAKQSKQKSRSYSFESMNRDKRHFIHEYCEHFGVESAAYDAEPNRNVVATAVKDRSWLPSMSLLEVIQRENGHRKVPIPVIGHRSATQIETVSLKLLSVKRTE